MYFKSQNSYLAAVYLRLSRDDGDKVESDSIRNQRSLLRDFANQHNDITLVKEYIDDGYSGANFERPGFQKMLEDAKEHKINCIIVKDLSRLGRNYIETGRYLEKIFPVLGIRFIAVNDHYDSADTENDADQIIVPFKNLINDAYCRDISIKIRSQFDVKRKRGQFISNYACYGYKKDPDNKNHLVIDEYAAEIVRTIFNMKLDGFSAQNIAADLSDMGVLIPTEYKVYRAEVVAKVDIDDENIAAFLQNVINKLKAIKIQPETQRQWITQEQPVDVVQIWIAKDYLDVSDIKNFAYQAYWENDDILYWCKQLGTSRVQIENMAYRKNTDYERQRKDREKYVLPDDVIKEFWKTNLKKLIVETESVIYAYSNFYVNKELSYEDLRKKARDAYSKLNDVYRTVVEEWFPLTDSDLKDYSKQSYDLAIDIQELLFLLNSDKGEEWAISNFKLKLIKYYRSMEAWKEATDKLE